MLAAGEPQPLRGRCPRPSLREGTEVSWEARRGAGEGPPSRSGLGSGKPASGELGRRRNPEATLAPIPWERGIDLESPAVQGATAPRDPRGAFPKPHSFKL